ncbi:MAG: anhydro-N-acetylmuramic acid kinase [Marinilabiliales bacterium]|nr:MAG: anhydro-N-acetylmuramic acid kinase [Marinilabiliales bacterium]
MIQPEKTSEWEYGIGLMSGTSLDGVDIAYCGFRYIEDRWEFIIEKAVTYDYPTPILQLISEMPAMAGEGLIAADRKLGSFYGKLCKRFIVENSLNPGFLASHGHTIFHKPNAGYTFQAGNGAEIAHHSGIMTISDFRSADVAKGGQGAPLVPIGDELLFNDFDAVINLGGFSNISFHEDGKRMAFDICPVNIALNHFAKEMGFTYDEDGMIAAEGAVCDELLTELNVWGYYSLKPPKSLGREDFENEFLPIISNFNYLNSADVLRTLIEHMAIQISHVSGNFSKVLFTGGGIRNRFLEKQIKARLGEAVYVPSDVLVEYKEAMIFAFLGLLRIKGKANILSSATGASADSCSGLIHLP